MENNERITNLRTDYLIFSSVSFGLIIMGIFFLINSYITGFDKQMETQQKNTLELISDTIFTINEKHEAISKNDLMKIISVKAVSDYNLSLIAVKDLNNGKIIASTNAAYTGREITDTRLISEAIKQNNKYITKNKKGISVFISFKDNSEIDLENLQFQLKILVICALLFCIAISWALSQRVTGPINQLKEATKAYSKGTFNFKISKTKYIELNELIESYNFMADSLEELYKNLENKVKERTLKLEEALNELKNTQSMMVHSEKMKSLGELVAGIMHEINNPVNFIYGNLIHLNNYTNDLVALVDKFKELETTFTQEKLNEASEFEEEIDYEFIKEDLPALIKSCREGTERTKNIVQDLKNFSRMDANNISTINLPKEIDTTLNILHNKLKNRIEIHKEYAPDLPEIDCLGGQLNQVFMNILDNAAFAIKDKGDIYIRLNFDEKYVLIEFEDTGSGMSQESVNKIFDPFYTTKPVGQGTGLGMSISYKVIKNHSGEITVSSQEGKGTIFKIKLPINYIPNEEAATTG